LGGGELADVYAVLDRKTDRRLALKVLRDEARAHAGRERLEQEYRLLTSFVHPNLVRAYDWFAEGRECFFSLELVDGRDFVAHVRADVVRGTAGKSPAAPRRAAWVACTPEGIERLRRCLVQLVSALTTLHAHGYAHGDVRASNVLVAHGGRLVLLDHGLARPLNGAAQGSAGAGVAPPAPPPNSNDPNPNGAVSSAYAAALAPGSLLGTATHLAPEFADGALPSAASDWYSLGVLLFEALTGALPFTGGAAEIMVRKRSVPAPLVSAMVGVTAADLEAWTARLLAIEPAQRPTDEELSAAFPRTQRDAPSAAVGDA
jgi:serine/threonine protein kinase